MSGTVDRIREAGVVGAGGAGFPTHVKLAGSVDTVIANGTECEPLLEADQRLMVRYADRVVEGLRLAMEATGASRGVIAVKSKYEAALAELRKAAASKNGIEFYLFGSFYPAGDEHVVVHDVTGRTVPEGGIPLETGVVVQNVGTLVNIANAVKGFPVTRRVITVAGEVVRPATFEAPIGTSFAELISWAGGINGNIPEAPGTDGGPRLVEGGPMMGRIAREDDVVTKTTSGLLVLPASNIVVRHLSRPDSSILRRNRSTCDQCRMCTDLCPRFLLGHELEPHRIMRSLNHGLSTEPRTITAAILCCECRLCEAYSCPLELSPVRYYKRVKQELLDGGFKNTIHRRKDLEPNRMRDYRRVPLSKLVDRLGLTRYKDIEAPFVKTPGEPAAVEIPLKQHLGAPSVPVVETGAEVSTGDLIAKIPDGALGANIHASISGIVVGVGDARLRITRKAALKQRG